MPAMTISTQPAPSRQPKGSSVSRLELMEATGLGYLGLGTIEFLIFKVRPIRCNRTTVEIGRIVQIKRQRNCSASAARR